MPSTRGLPNGVVVEKLRMRVDIVAVGVFLDQFF
jgi:hypothetical protein